MPDGLRNEARPTALRQPRRSHRRLLAAGLAAALAAAAACRVHDHAPAAPHPLVVIGVDGLEWRLVLDMMKVGRLPEIRRLIDDGTFARLSTLEPALSPPIWTSIATGMLPAHHGILGFVRPDLQGRNGQPVLFTSGERRVKAIWDIAGDAGLSSCVIGYWMTFPVEQMRGVMVAQTGAPPGSELQRTRKGGLEPGRSGQVQPPELEERVFALARDSAAEVDATERDLYGDTSTWPPSMKSVAGHSRWSLAADTAYERIALDLVREAGRCDLLIVYLGLTDVLGHRFWRWTYPGDFASPPALQEIERFGEVLGRAYARVDSFVGQMRRAAGAGATVVVASDHGMGPWRANASVDLAREDAPLVRTGGHSGARDAFLVAAGPGIARGASDARAATLPDSVAAVPRRGSILDVTPSLLALLGVARGADMDGHVLPGLLDVAFVRAHPLSEIASHTPQGWAASRRIAPADDAGGEDRIEQLRGLGYLE